MATSYKPNNTTHYEIRSISLPTTLHPSSTHIIEKEVNDIKKWMLSSCNKPSTETICNGLMKLSTMYEGIHELIIELLSSIQAEKWVEEFMDKLVGFLDICGIMKDTLLQTKEQVRPRDLQYALRRRKGDSSSVENNNAKYNCLRKKVKKDVKILMACLSKSKLMKSNNRHQDHEVVISMAMEVTISLFECLSILIVMPVKQTPKISKWSMVVSKLARKTKVTCEEHHYDQQTNDFEGLDVMSRNECTKFDACRLEKMEAQIVRIEDSLDCICRRLIRTRVSLLNIVSSY